jgi:hypothetical protein
LGLKSVGVLELVVMLVESFMLVRVQAVGFIMVFQLEVLMVEVPRELELEFMRELVMEDFIVKVVALELIWPHLLLVLEPPYLQLLQYLLNHQDLSQVREEAHQPFLLEFMPFTNLIIF